MFSFLLFYRSGFKTAVLVGAVMRSKINQLLLPRVKSSLKSNLTSKLNHHCRLVVILTVFQSSRSLQSIRRPYVQTSLKRPTQFLCHLHSLYVLLCQHVNWHTGLITVLKSTKQPLVYWVCSLDKIRNRRLIQVIIVNIEAIYTICKYSLLR